MPWLVFVAGGVLLTWYLAGYRPPTTLYLMLSSGSQVVSARPGDQVVISSPTGWLAPAVTSLSQAGAFQDVTPPGSILRVVLQVNGPVGASARIDSTQTDNPFVTGSIQIQVVS